MTNYLETIVPQIRAGKSVLIAAHGNSLRALVKYLDNISDEDILNLNIPTGTPLVYELGDDFKAINHRYLGDQEAIEAKMKAVAKQGAKTLDRLAYANYNRHRLGGANKNNGFRHFLQKLIKEKIYGQVLPDHINWLSG